MKLATTGTIKCNFSAAIEKMKKKSLENLLGFVVLVGSFFISLFAVHAGMNATYERRSAYSNIQYTLVHHNNNNNNNTV